MSRTTDKPKGQVRPATTGAAARKGTPKAGAGQLARSSAQQQAVSRLPSLAHAKRRTRAGRTSWHALDRASGHAPTPAHSAKP